MNKRESLAFLQSCIDQISVTTDEEIAMFQESYALNCMNFFESSEFMFIPPTIGDNCLYERRETRDIVFSGNECGMQGSRMQWKFNVKGTVTINEQGNDNLPYAA